MLLLAMYCRTNLFMPQLAPLFGISTAAVGRIIKRHGPLLALASARHRPGSDDNASQRRMRARVEHVSPE